MTIFDKRLTPARADLAAAHLSGTVEAPRFVEGRRMRVAAATAPLRGAPGIGALETEALHGEAVEVYETAGGFSWGQLAADGYVGYLPSAALGEPVAAPTHRVISLRTHAFPGPSIKLPPAHLISMGSLVAIAGEEGRFLVTPDGLHIPARHLAPIDWVAPDYAAVAERFVGTPYLWGGRTSLGLDCSGLLQVSMAAAGLACPRDSDQQEGIDQAVDIEGDLAGLRRGDHVHWKGHVGIMLDGERLLHANAFYMQVVIEPLREARDRTLASSGGPITSVRRPARLGRG